MGAEEDCVCSSESWAPLHGLPRHPAQASEALLLPGMAGRGSGAGQALENRVRVGSSTS